jgi:hypothetical protein
MDGEEAKMDNMDTHDYCPICAEAIVLQNPQLGSHSCFDTDAVLVTEIETAQEEAPEEMDKTANSGRPNTGWSATHNQEQPDTAVANLRSIWARQLTSRKERVLHGHFEGDLARHLQPVLAHVISK